jgi:hypothetical protein
MKTAIEQYNEAIAAINACKSLGQAMIIARDYNNSLRMFHPSKQHAPLIKLEINGDNFAIAEQKLYTAASYVEKQGARA